MISRSPANIFEAIGAYAFLAALSAVFFLIGYRYDARHSRTAYDEVVDTYFQSIMYFGMSAQIAFWAYLPKMETLYELTLGRHNCRSHEQHSLTLRKVNSSQE